MDSQERLERALEDGLKAVTDGASASAVVRAALRVATLRQDPLAELWLRIEISGVHPQEKQTDDATGALGRLATLVGADEAEKQRVAAFELLLARRSFQKDQKEVVLSFGVAEIEAYRSSMQAMHDQPITPGMTPLDTGVASIRRDKTKELLGPQLLQQITILERIKDAAYRYLLGVESELMAGKSVPDVVAQGRSFVEARLAKISPDALSALASAQDRLAQGDPEALSHAATSCRRTIKAIADALYPAGNPVLDDNGIERVMDEDHYRNRLVQYVRQQKGRSTHADLLASNLVTLGTRLKSLDDLASKGVHTEVSRAEAESCVSWTYMLAADLLRVEQESS